MSDFERIRKTLAQYCHYFDERRYAEWADLFAEDGTWTVGGESADERKVVSGRDAIKAFASSFPPSSREVKHTTTDSIIQIDGDRASVVSNLIVYVETPEGGKVLRAGRYLDSLTRHGEHWLFLSRVNDSRTWGTWE